MKIANILKPVLLTSAFAIASFASFSQKASPDATATGTINGAHVTIRYSSPSVRGRQIYGTDLVPYGKVWRAGANTATVIETDKDLTVQGKTLPAGKYSIYAIASDKDWVIIFNSQTGQWGINHDGTTTEDPAKDVIRVNVTPRRSASMNERLIYTINNDGIVLSWENLDIPVAMR